MSGNIQFFLLRFCKIKIEQIVLAYNEGVLGEPLHRTSSVRKLEMGK